MATRAPSRAKATAMARPIPADAPVTMTTLSLRPISMGPKLPRIVAGRLEETATSGCVRPWCLEGPFVPKHTLLVLAVSSTASEFGRARLDRFIERIHVATPHPGETHRAVDLLPDGTMSLVLRLLGGGAGDVGVRGTCTRAYYKTAPALPLAVRVVFRPGGAYPFFGVPINELTDRLVVLEDLWGASGREMLERALVAADRGDDVAAVVEMGLLERMRAHPFEPASALAARAAVRLLARGDHSVDDVVRELGISARHLRRAFQAVVGVAPKTFARIARFQRALALGRARPGRWNEVARATGYFDQAHLTTD